MPTPASGQISLSDVALIIYNSTTAQISLYENEVFLLSGVGSGQVALSNLYNKPTVGNTGSTYYSPGSYSWIVVPYKTLTATVAGAGGGGGGYCGGQFYFGCVNYRENYAGSSGNQTDFNGTIAYGGGGGQPCNRGVGSSGGNNINANTGGGGAGGAGNTNPLDTSCNQASGSNGGPGGRAVTSWTKGVNGPSYGSTINFTVGAGGVGSCNPDRCAPGGPGGSGYVNIAWS